MKHEKRRFDKRTDEQVKLDEMAFEISGISLDVDLDEEKRKKKHFKPFLVGVPEYSTQVAYPTESVKKEPEFAFNVLDNLLDLADDDIFAEKPEWKRRKK